MKFFLFILINLCLFSCSNTYHGAKKICEGKFYVEYYTEGSGMAACYLTDSVKFRVKVSRYNAESEFHKFTCSQDSVIVETWTNFPAPSHILKTKKFNTKKLIEDGKFED